MKKFILLLLALSLCTLMGCKNKSPAETDNATGAMTTIESPQIRDVSESTPLAPSTTVSPEESTPEPIPEESLPITPTPEASPSPDMPDSADIQSSQLMGYWANIFQGSDGTAHLSGFYFAEKGTGLVFTASEGARTITSHIYLNNELFLSFSNTEDMPAEWLYQIDSLSENELILSDDFYIERVQYEYKRVLKIEPYNCTGGYTVTQLDGVVLDIIGY